MYSITTTAPSTTVYNSVLLNKNGIIQQVRTTFLSCRSAWQKIDRYITLYTFSEFIEQQFAQGYVPFRFEVDDAEPDNEYHSALQQIIIEGSSFINQQRKASYQRYAEVVVVFANKDTCNVADVRGIVRCVLNYYNTTCNWPRWKAFAWRKIYLYNTLMVAISIGK